MCFGNCALCRSVAPCWFCSARAVTTTTAAIYDYYYYYCYEQQAASPKAAGSLASKAGQEKTASVDASPFGAATATAVAGPIPAGTRVEYLSQSQGKWLPAMVQGYDTAAGTYKLDVKPAAASQDVRVPCSLLRLDPNCGLQVSYVHVWPFDYVALERVVWSYGSRKSHIMPLAP